jgi:hypothetical protein
MEGAERALKAFQTNFFQRWCCTAGKKKLKFRSKYMLVEKTVDPELIIWQNFGMSKKQRFVRKALYYVYVLSVLLICFYSILRLEKLCQDSEDMVLSISCSSVTEEAALADFDKKAKNRTGDFHCYCKNLYQDQGFDVLSDPLCDSWVLEYYKITAITTLIPCVMGIMCILFEICI